MNGFLEPTTVLKQLKLKEDMTAADFGCGSGGWAIPLAKSLEMGQVHCIDILEEPLSALRATAQIEKVSNIKILQVDVDQGSTLANASCDLVLMTNLLFQVDDVNKVVEEGKRVLKKGGKILVVDWKEKSPLGPQGRRVGMADVKTIAKTLKLKVEKELEAGAYHYALVLVK